MNWYALLSFNICDVNIQKKHKSYHRDMVMQYDFDMSLGLKSQKKNKNKNKSPYIP